MSAKKTTAHTAQQSHKQKKKNTATASPPTSELRPALFLGLIAFFVFANTLGHGFVLDDQAVITQNAIVQEGIAGIPRLLTTFYWEGYWHLNAGLYRPMSMISFAIEWSISPDNPGIHHFMNVLLYALSVGLLYRVLRMLLTGYPQWIAFGATLLFAVHPVHTEVVANIKSRDEILCFLFFLLTFRYLLKHGSGNLRHQLTAGLLFLLCLLSKEAGILFLPIMAFAMLLIRRQRPAPTAKMLLPLLIASAVWLGWHQYIVQGSDFERITYSYQDNSLVACSGSSQVATGFYLLGSYLLKAFAPLHFSYDYSFNEIPCQTFGSPLVLLTLAVLAATGWLIFKTYRKHPLVSFGLLFFFTGMALTTNIFTLIGTTMGDRLLYAPVLGICLFTVAGAAALVRSESSEHPKRPLLYGAIGVAIVFTVLSFTRNRDWESNETLFLADLAHSPNSARVHFNIGALQLAQLPPEPERQQPYLPQIAAHFKRAAAIDPRDRNSHINLGVCYYRLKQYDKSVYHTRKALNMEPADTSLWGNIADGYFQLQQKDSALYYYRKLETAGKATANNYNFMGALYFREQQYTEAVRVFSRGNRLFPNDQELLLNLGSALGAAGNPAAARDTLLKLLEINPQHQGTMRFLSMAYQQLGNISEAQRYAAMAAGK